MAAAGAGDGFHIGLTLFGLRHSVRHISTTKSKAVSFTIWFMKYRSIIYFHIVYSAPCYLVCYSSRACRQSHPLANSSCSRLQPVSIPVCSHIAVLPVMTFYAEWLR